MVVKAASAMQLAGNNFYLLEDCDHMQVCKPPSKEHQSYFQLLDVLRTCREGTDPPAVWCERAEQTAALDGTGQVERSETPKWHGHLLGCRDFRVREVYKMVCKSLWGVQVVECKSLEHAQSVFIPNGKFELEYQRHQNIHKTLRLF